MEEFHGHWLSERSQTQKKKDCILSHCPVVTESRLVVPGAWVGLNNQGGTWKL